MSARALAVAWAALVTLPSAPLHAAPPEDVIAVIVGANVGDDADEPLRFAESDARRLREALLEVAGLSSERALLVTGGSPDAVLGALERARQLAAALGAAGHAVSFYFYYSGHGDERALHLASGPLLLDELRRRVALVPARLRVTLLDACRTGGRARGISRGPRFALDVTPDLPVGNVEIRASAGGEAAQESEELGGAVFSHFLLSGLRGAADGDHDGAVTLSELYGYIYRRTLLRTGERAPVVQHPELRAAITGSGEIVISRPAPRSRWLEAPSGPGRYLVFAWPSGSTVGELEGGDESRLALRPGRYLVVRRVAGTVAAVEVDLSWPWGAGAGSGVAPSGSPSAAAGRRLSAAEFRPLSREELAARGGTIELHPYRLELRVAAEALPGAADLLGIATAVALCHGRGRLHLGADLGYAAAATHTSAYSGWRHAAAAGVEVGLRWFFDRVTVTAALGVVARLEIERLQHVDRERVLAVGFDPDRRLIDVAAGPRASLRALVPLGDRLSLGPWLSLAALVRREDDGTSSGSTARVAIHPDIELGIVLATRL